MQEIEGSRLSLAYEDSDQVPGDRAVLSVVER